MKVDVQDLYSHLSADYPTINSMKWAMRQCRPEITKAGAAERRGRRNYYDVEKVQQILTDYSLGLYAKHTSV